MTSDHLSLPRALYRIERLEALTAVLVARLGGRVLVWSRELDEAPRLRCEGVPGSGAGWWLSVGEERERTGETTGRVRVVALRQEN